ncbi:MAG: hypothetical protein JWO52_2060 [Gammaproteobacteria bacterium]|nr:hypothetical protein [Gammaproteobacteria bacterium]
MLKRKLKAWLIAFSPECGPNLRSALAQDPEFGHFSAGCPDSLLVAESLLAFRPSADGPVA